MTTPDTGQDPTDVQCTTPQLNIASHEQLRQFLKVIQPKFLEVVDPRESGLLDVLYSADLLTDTDHESMSGKDVKTRKDQARKLWFLLNMLSVDDFTTSVVPELCRLYPHIIPQRFQAQDVDIEARKECLRHDIMSRIRVATMADMLYQHDCLCFEDYRDIASSEHGCHDVMWAKMFDSCANKDEHLTTGLVRGFQTLLQRYKVQVPACLAVVVSRGIPCTCNKAEAVLPDCPAFGLKKVGSWLMESQFQCISRSSGTFSTKMDSRNFSGACTSVRDDNSQSISSDKSVDLGLPLTQVGSWLMESQFQCISRSSVTFSTKMDSRNFSGACTSVRDDDSQSISSDNTVVPGLPLTQVGSWLKKSPFQRIPRSSGSFSTGMDSRNFSGTSTSVSDDNSQSSSSDNTVVPDLLTTFLASPRVGFDHAAANLSAIAEANQVVLFAKSSLVDAVEVSETPAVSGGVRWWRMCWGKKKKKQK